MSFNVKDVFFVVLKTPSVFDKFLHEDTCVEKSSLMSDLTSLYLFDSWIVIHYIANYLGLPFRGYGRKFEGLTYIDLASNNLFLYIC